MTDVLVLSAVAASEVVLAVVEEVAETFRTTCAPRRTHVVLVVKLVVWNALQVMASIRNVVCSALHDMVAGIPIPFLFIEVVLLVRFFFT